MERKNSDNNHQYLDINLLQDSDSHKFINTRIKIKNTALENNRAWIIAQPLLSACVIDYPDKTSSDLEPIRKVFDLRRDTFLRKIEPKDASWRVQETMNALPIEQQDRIIRAIVCIRDFFDRPSPFKKFRSR